MRDLDSSQQAAVASRYVRPIYLLQLVFDDATLFFHTGVGTFIWNGDTYTGAGNLLTIDLPEETTDIAAREATFSLSGIPDSILAVALNENYSGRPVKVWYGFLDNAGALIGSPVQEFAGSMDVMTISEDPSSPTISLTAESDLAKLGRSKERRYTAEDQKMDYPDDTGFDYVAGLQDTQIIWGKVV